MKNYNYLKISLLSSTVLNLIGTSLKISHSPFAIWVLSIGILAYLTFMVLALKEIFMANSITSSEKWMWVTGFLFVLAPLASYLYLFSARNRVLEPRYNFRSKIS